MKADQGQRTKEETAGKIEVSHEGIRIGGAFAKKKNPDFLKERLAYFDAIYQEQQKALGEVEKREIDVVLKDGKILKGKCFQTTPLDIANKISKNLGKSSIVSRVKYLKRDTSPVSGYIIDCDEDQEINLQNTEEGELWDMFRPLEGDCKIELFDFESPAGQQVFWHSSSHLLGQVLEQEYGAHLTIGPPLANGFYYDCYIGEEKIVPSDYDAIEKAFTKLAGEKQIYQRVVLNKKQALELFKHNPFKVQLLTHKIPENGVTTAYRCGTLIDLCTGPHIICSEKVKAFKVTKSSSAYWLSNSKNDSLQRVYGISFPSEKQLTEYIKIQEEIAKRDHRNIGEQQNLFFFHVLSPGSAFFYPYGARIYNKLIDIIRREYRARGYTEVITPNIYNAHLWQTSGHYFKYKENMYFIDIEKEEFATKPMNCPGHCVLFDSQLLSYRDLPKRYAEFGVLHRNEISGALSGLTRVRRFVQDDCHIFCTEDQIQDEIVAQLDLLNYIYGIFGFEFKLNLSTRPENYLGTVEMWDIAEAKLTEALNKFGRPWSIKPKDGAFYGPKIDVQVFDAMKREHQCGTVQLDFQLPTRFNLQYKATDADHGEHSHADNNDQEEENENKAKPAEKKDNEKQSKGKKGKEKKGDSKKKHSKKEDHLKSQSSANDSAHKKEETSSKQEEKVEVKAETHEAKPETHDTKSPHKEGEEEKKICKHESHHSHHHHKDQPVENNEAIPLMSGKYGEDTWRPGKLKPGFKRPVMIHRAILGSIERMLAILCEHTGGKWPFFLSPRQVIICPVSEKFVNYADKVLNRIEMEGFFVEMDKSNVTLNKKIRNAQIHQFFFIGVVGEKEEQTGCITVRSRDGNNVIGTMTIPEFVAFLKSNEPEASGAEKKRWMDAYFHPNEKGPLNKVGLDEEDLKNWNSQLDSKVFFTGDGFGVGEEDDKIWKRLQVLESINQAKYPNLWKWYNLMKKVRKSSTS